MRAWPGLLYSPYASQVSTFVLGSCTITYISQPKTNIVSQQCSEQVKEAHNASAYRIRNKAACTIHAPSRSLSSKQRQTIPNPSKDALVFCGEACLGVATCLVWKMDGLRLHLPDSVNAQRRDRCVNRVPCSNAYAAAPCFETTRIQLEMDFQITNPKMHKFEMCRSRSGKAEVRQPCAMQAKSRSAWTQ